LPGALTFGTPCGMLLHRLLLLLGASALLGACTPSAEKQMLNLKTANSRALEQKRMNMVTTYADDDLGPRGAEILVADPGKEFDPSVARFGRASTVGTKAVEANQFNVKDGVRTKGFATRGFESNKNAWMGDVKFETKAAPVKESWFSKVTARTKTYDTKQSYIGDKTAATRPLVVGDKTFVAKGRRQAIYDSKGAAAQALGGDRFSGESWSGDLRPLTIDDVKKLLNKN